MMRRRNEADFLSKELSKITMPIVWNEPVSFLQRFTENVLYSYLLDRADECTDPLMRMQVRNMASVPIIVTHRSSVLGSVRCFIDRE